MLSGTYQSMVMSLMAGSIAFFRDLISWGGEGNQCQTRWWPLCSLPSPHLCPGITLGCSLSAGLKNSAWPRLTLAMPFSSRRHARGPMPKLKHLQESQAVKSHGWASARVWAAHW